MSTTLQKQAPKIPQVRVGIGYPNKIGAEYKVRLKTVIDAHKSIMLYGDHSGHLTRRMLHKRKPISDELYDRLKHIAPQWAYALKQGCVPNNANLSIRQPKICIMGEAFGGSDAYRLRFNGYCDICLYFDKHGGLHGP